MLALQQSSAKKAMKLRYLQYSFFFMMMMSDLQYHNMQTAGKYLFLNTSLACLTLFYLSPDLL